MIRKDDLLEAISHCHGDPKPNANTCIKLAAYYTILNNLDQDEQVNVKRESGYSFSAPVYSSETEFGKVIGNLDQIQAMRILDELMETIRVMHPRLYDAVMRNLTALE